MPGATSLIHALEIRTRAVLRQTDEWAGAHKSLSSQQSVLVDTLQTTFLRVALHDEANIGFHSMEEEWRGRFEKALAELVSQGLSSVFGDDRKVILTHSIKRGVANLDLEMETNGLRTRIIGAKGGSVIQILAFLFRVLFTVSQNPPLLPLLILDEPFSMVSAKYRGTLGELVHELSRRLNIQFILASHEEEIAEASDVTYEIVADGKGTSILRKSAEEERE